MQRTEAKALGKMLSKTFDTVEGKKSRSESKPAKAGDTADTASVEIDSFFSIPMQNTIFDRNIVSFNYRIMGLCYRFVLEKEKQILKL